MTIANNKNKYNRYRTFHAMEKFPRRCQFKPKVLKPVFQPNRNVNTNNVDREAALMELKKINQRIEILETEIFELEQQIKIVQSADKQCKRFSVDQKPINK